MNWRRLIFDNIGWKLGSLFIAMMIWSSYHTGEEEGLDIGSKFFRNLATKDFIGRQVQLLSQQNSPKNVELTPKFVTISLRGELDAIKPITLNDVLVYVDISNLLPGTTNRLGVEVNVPPNIIVDHITPSNITVYVPATPPPTQ